KSTIQLYNWQIANIISKLWGLFFPLIIGKLAPRFNLFAIGLAGIAAVLPQPGALPISRRACR
ncbi:MAG: hypothetical protein KDI83_15430, partial [Gammaproteobacteria bacterium]|nr:hypothetical protein [Gammaproteobacteria bacterium]